MSAATQQQRPTVTFHTPADSLRQATLKKNMSITQTYYLAHKARAKLSREAARPDHNLRLLVGHANLLDSLMVELADAEREQERWFNQSVRNSSPKEDRKIQWAEKIASVPEEDYDSSSDSESDSDFDSDDDMETMTPAVVVSIKKHVADVEGDEIMEDDLEEDYAQLELVRTPSHSNNTLTQSPPELLIDHESSDLSDDESMPPSPENEALPLPREKDIAEEDHDLFDEDYYLPGRTAAMVTPISVY